MLASVTDKGDLLLGSKGDLIKERKRPTTRVGKCDRQKRADRERSYQVTEKREFLTDNRVSS